MRIDRVKFITELTKKDMTLKSLAKLSGISYATLSYIKQGKSCKDEIGQAIAKALNVNIKDLLED